MEVTAASRLAKVITSSRPMRDTTAPRTPSTSVIPVESIVKRNRLQEAQAELAVVSKVQSCLISTATTTVKKINELSKTLSLFHKEQSAEFIAKMSSTINHVVPALIPEKSVSPVASSLFKVMVEQSVLLEEYRISTNNMRRELQSKDAIVHELTVQMQNSKVTSVPNIALKLACILDNPTEDNRFLIAILTDLIQNNGVASRNSKRWSDDTKDLFAIILDYGGPALAKIVSERLQGPSVATTFRRARSTWATPLSLKEVSIQRAALFYEKIGYNGPFILAVDATAIVPTLRIKGNTVYGLATESDVVVSSAQDVIDIVKNTDTEKARQANAFVLAPLREHVPSFVLAISPVVNGQSYLTVDKWYKSIVQWCSAKGMKVIGIGADGDSKVRKYYNHRFIKNQEQCEPDKIISIPYESFEYVSAVEIQNNVETPSLMFPDWRHLIKKWRNQLLNLKRVLILGNHIAQLEHVIETYKTYRLESGLWKSDILVKDKQNVNAATRILGTSVQQCMAAWNNKRSVGTQAYLKIGQNLLSAYTEPNLSIRERSRLAWSVVSFLRLWKAWINISGNKMESSFISDQTYQDFILSGHSIILSMKIFSVYFPDQPYHPWVFGSNECEDLFAGLRGFCRGKSNLCMLDMIELSGRVQKLKELKITTKGLPTLPTPDWKSINVESEIIEGMKMADKQVLKTMESLGMLPELRKGNIIRQEGNTLIYLNRVVETWIESSDFMPDESDVVDITELLELDNGILFQAFEEQIENNHCNALSNLAASASSSAAGNDNSGDLNDDDDDDDDNPTNCAFHSKGKCLYQDKKFRRPKETSWIGCEFPNCNDWFHESCLGLQLKENERDSYTFICNKHNATSEHLGTKVQASVSDSDLLLGDTCTAPKLLPKRLRNSKPGSKTGSKGDKKYSQSPSYVEFEGHFFHIAEFLSIQEGKVYRPQTSRIARWMASSQSDFYERIDEMISPQKTDSGLYLNDFASFWVQDKGLQIGKIIRMVWSPNYKSSYPVFEWKQNEKGKGKTSVCIRCWSHSEFGEKWKLQPQNIYQWCDPKGLLEKYPADESDTERLIDPSKLKILLPRLEKLEQQRLEKMRQTKAKEREEAKRGAPENLTKELLTEILVEHGIRVKKSTTKAELINKVLELRTNFQDNNTMTVEDEGPTDDPVNEIASATPNAHLHSLSAEHKQLDHQTPVTCSEFRESEQNRGLHKSRLTPCVIYYFDERMQRKLIMLLQIFFILELFSLCLDFIMVRYIWELLISLFHASVFSVAEYLLNVTLKAHSIFLLIIVMLSSLSVARVNIGPLLHVQFG